MHLFFAGIKHCGKSTIARLLSEEYNKPFKDTDDLITDLIAPLSVREFYQSHGKDSFNQLEFFALSHYLQDKDQEQIIALGGGACDNKPLIHLCKEQGALIYLFLDEETLWKRIIKDGIPPFLQADSPRSSFHDLYMVRNERYQQFCTLLITLDGSKSPQENLHTIKQSLQQGGLLWDQTLLETQ